MSVLLKDMYNYDSVKEFALSFNDIYPDFNVEGFVNATIDDTWDNLELKARVRHISINLGKYLPNDYLSAIEILNKVVSSYSGFFGIIFPDFIEVYGQDQEHYETTKKALEYFSQYSSSEFAVRPFIINNELDMMNTMYQWSKSDNEHTRRLASEGCRPALPWGQALTKYKKDPSPIIPILEQLKNDESLYVRKSVANNLNDISKTHPELVIDLVKQWHGKDKNTDWIIKHGTRTLLKQGNREVLALFGYHDSASLEILNFKQSSDSISLNDNLSFEFDIKASDDTKVRLEYAIYYVKANGKRNKKVFKISEITLNKDQVKSYKKNHKFKDLTTRKHYPGLHRITLIVNGLESESSEFELKF